MSDDKKLIAYLENIIKGLVSNPKDVFVTRSIDEMGVLYTVKVAQVDVGKIIGKGGSVAISIRALLRIAGILIDERASLKIDAPEIKPNKYEGSREQGDSALGL